MADLPLVDTHVHFWDLNHPTLRYIWLEDGGDDSDIDWSQREAELGNWGSIKSRRYWPEDFAAESRFATVEAAIHVQAAIGSPNPVDETRWLQEAADRCGMPQGIIAYVDLENPNAREMLDAHGAFANLRGVRDIRYDDYLTNELWQAGYHLLEERGLVCCDDPVLDGMNAASQLARLSPGITYCVDHAGFPRRRDQAYFREWRRGMRAIAQVENTIVKVSGLGMCDHVWTVESLKPWVLECIDAWSPERVVFGTNWPVDRVYSSYPDIVDAYREIISQFSNNEQMRMFSENARRIFGLDGPSGLT